MKEENEPMAAAGLKKAKATTNKRVQTVAVKARATRRRRVRSRGSAALEKHSKPPAKKVSNESEGESNDK